MKTLLESATDLRDNISKRLFRISKKTYQQLKTNPNEPKTVIFVIGCQRSGTTLMLKIFHKDMNARVYGEYSVLTRKDKYDNIRLVPLSVMEEIISKDKVSLIISKPLVETQNSLKLLDYFRGSKALWMYRHYKDVASSNLKNFGTDNGIKNLRAIVDNLPDNWRSEGASAEVRQVVLKYFAEDMSPHDAAALFWFVRNSLFFELNLDKNSDVMIFKYDSLVTSPLEMVKKVYEFMGHEFPGDKILTDVHPSSVGKGKNIKLSPEIESLCQELLIKLDDVYQAKDYYTKPFIDSVKSVRI